MLRIAHRLTLLLLTVTLLPGCRTLSNNPDRVASYAQAPAQTGPLMDVTSALRGEHGGEVSGFLPLDVNREGLEWRLALADSAQHTLDAKYFLFFGAGAKLLLDRMVKAADRGVRVRLLVDDLFLRDKDESVALLSTHPNIEVRVYNPWHTRDGGKAARVMEGMVRFDSVNHRMHNKLFVADNHVAVVGGRNVGDPYFGLSDTYNVRDFDLVVAGPIVPKLSIAFDDYWNSEIAYPGDQMIKHITSDDLPQVYERLGKALEQNRERLESFPLEPRDWTPELAALPDRMYTGTARVIFDEARDEGAEHEGQMLPILREFTRQAQEELLYSTPYLILNGSPMSATREEIARGVTVKVLTNSLASIDSDLPYSGYRKDRDEILGAGVELYELRSDAEVRSMCNTPPVEAEWLALHAKLMVVDREKLFVGTFNLDSRSKFINSEMGLLIDSPGLARKVAERLDRDMGPDNAWRVRLDENGNEYWESSAGRRDDAPTRGFGQSVDDFFFGILDLQDQL